MISNQNIENASTATGTCARFSLLGLLLLSFGLLLSAFQPAAAQTTYTLSPLKDNSVSPGGLDIVKITASPATPGTVILYVSVDNSGSLYQVILTDGVGTWPFSHTPAGSVNLYFYTNPDGDVGSLVGSIQMHFISAPGPPDPNVSYFTVTTDMQAADGSAQDVVEAFLYDKDGNIINGLTDNATITWTLPNGNTTANFVGVTNPTIPQSITLNVNGVGTSSEPLTDTKAESVPLTASVTYTDPTTGLPGNITLTDRVAAGPTFVQPTPSTTPGANWIVTVISPNPADGNTADQVQVYVVDQNGVPMTGAAITWTIPPGLTQAAGSTSTTVNGYATLNLTTLTAGSYQISATVNGQPLTDKNNAADNFVTVVFYPPPIDQSKSYITPVIPSVAVGGNDEVEIHLSSASGPLTGATVTLGTLPTGVTAVTQGPYVTDANGNVFIYLTSTIAGPYDISASYTDPGPSGGTTTLDDETLTTQPYSVIQFVAGPVSSANSYIVVTHDNATDNNTDADIVTAYLYDAYGNPIYPSSNPTLNWAVAPADPANTTIPTIQSTTSTPGSNVYTVDYVSPTKGPYTVTLLVNGAPIDAQGTTTPNVTIHFVVGQPVTGDPGGPGNGGDPGGGSPGNGGNPPPNNGGNPPPNNGGGSTGGGPGNGGDPGTNNGFTEIYVLSQYNYRLADGQQQDSVYVYVTDATKNPVSGVTVTFYIQQPGGTITSGEQWTSGQTAAPITAVTGADGIARVAMTSTTPGSVWVYATIIDPTTGNPALVAKSDVEADFVTKPDITNIQTALTVIVGEAMADGTQQNVVKAHVVDIDGNVMPNQQVYFAIDSGTGTIVNPQPVTTDANGDAYIQITSKTVGYVLITAIVDSEKIVFGSPARVYFAMINIYVPRAFSPNNDGTNDLLKPILVGISTFHYFNIYNRWGNLIFTTQDPNQGWDGTFKGVPQPVETYLWIAEGIDENGHKVVQKGMTSLVR